MRIKKIANFFARSVGRSSFSLLILLSAFFVAIKTVTLILPFFVEQFVNALQVGSFKIQLIYIAATVYVAIFVLQCLVTFFYGKAQIRIKNQMQLFLVRTILRQNPNTIKTRGEGFFTALMEQSLDTILNAITPINLYNFFLVFQSLIVLVILYAKNIMVGIIGTILFALYALAYALNNKLLSNILMRFMEQANESIALIYDFIRGNTAVVASDSALDFADKKIAQVLQSVRKIEFRLEFLFDLIFSSLSNLFQPLSNLAVILVLGKSVLNGTLPFGTFVLLLTFFNILQNALSNFQDIAEILFHAEGAVKTIEEFLDEGAGNRKKLLKQNDSYFYKLDSVSLALNENVILKDFSLTLKEKNHYARVGYSGQGKSTLVNLLLGLCTPDSGNVFFLEDENNVKDVWAFEDTAYFCQSTDIFNLSLKENIFLGDASSDSEYAELVSLLELQKLEGRLLGSGGAAISGGEKQRVGLARFLHQVKNKNHYFIDEGFVSLDDFTKEKMLKITKEAIANKTGICITHDNSVFQELCNSVLVYTKNGTITQTEKEIEKPLKSYLGISKNSF